METINYIRKWQKPLYWFHGWENTLANKTKDISNTWVYLIEAENSNAVKIGKTKNPEKRFCTIDTMNADNIHKGVLLNFNLIEEKDLHEQFKYLNYKGEWFSKDDRLCYLLNKLKTS